MVSLDDIVLVSEQEFEGAYSDRGRAKAAINRLNKFDITFPIKYTSPFFPQLNWAAALVYLKGKISVSSKSG